MTRLHTARDQPHQCTADAFRTRSIRVVAAALAILAGCEKSPSFEGVATVSWMAPTKNSDGSAITDLAGYSIEYGTSPGNLNATVEVRDPRATHFTISHLGSGKTYYFRIVAVTAAGTRGAASVTVSKKIH